MINRHPGSGPDRFPPVPPRLGSPGTPTPFPRCATRTGPRQPSPATAIPSDCRSQRLPFSATGADRFEPTAGGPPLGASQLAPFTPGSSRRRVEIQASGRLAPPAQGNAATRPQGHIRPCDMGPPTPGHEFRPAVAGDQPAAERLADSNDWPTALGGGAWCGLGQSFARQAVGLAPQPATGGWPVVAGRHSPRVCGTVSVVSACPDAGLAG